MTKVLNIPIYQKGYKNILYKIKRSVDYHKKIYICVAATHLIMECQKNNNLLVGVQKADVVTPDGMPLVWLSKLYGNKNASRIYGPNLTLMVCKLAQRYRFKIFLLGGASGQSSKLAEKLQKQFPNLEVVGTQDTPIRPIPEKENNQIIKKINTAKPDIVFVGLGCPNQELWMISNRDKVNASTLIGVGAAFDFITGTVKQAPKWMQNNGLEWFFRLLQDPKRLWRRYTILNTLFFFKIGRQITKDFLYGKL